MDRSQANKAIAITCIMPWLIWYVANLNASSGRLDFPLALAIGFTVYLSLRECAKIAHTLLLSSSLVSSIDDSTPGMCLVRTSELNAPYEHVGNVHFGGGVLRFQKPSPKMGSSLPIDPASVCTSIAILLSIWIGATISTPSLLLVTSAVGRIVLTISLHPASIAAPMQPM